MPVDRSTTGDIQELWRKRIRQSSDYQKSMHGVWASNLAYAAGQHWTVWDSKFARLRSIREVDERYRHRELFTADRITEYRQAALGELTSDDDRPQLLAAQDGADGEAAATTLNALVGYAWDRDWNAPDAILQAREFCIDMGVSAIRCRWEPNSGGVIDHLPMDQSGSPVSDPGVMLHLEEHGILPDGSLPKFKPVREGRTCWEAYSAMQLFPPPGVVHEDAFPWEIVGRPVLVDEIRDVYGVKVDEQSGIVSTAGVVQGQAPKTGTQTASALRDHAWLYTCFERPSGRYPQGRSVVLAGEQFTVCDQQNELPYMLCDKPHAGLVYLHWWRLSDRFWSRSLVESMKDPQRIINRRETQNVELIDRGMPKMLTRRGDWPGDTTGAPLEVVELERTAQAPTILNGIGPGAWMYQDIDHHDQTISHASTLSPLRLGENPQAVDTYRQLALLNDNEQGKRASIISQHRRAFGELVELSLLDAQRYWPDEKQALIVGEDDTVSRAIFKKSEIPADYRVKPATGQPLPRTQGAQIQKIDSIFRAAVECAAVAQDPVGWAKWYKDSLDAGAPLDIPEPHPNSQQQIAHLENTMMRQGIPVPPADYDQLQQHLPIHREEQDAARARDDVQTFQLIEQHVQESLRMQQLNMQQAPPPVAPPAPSAPVAAQLAQPSPSPSPSS